MLANAFSAEYGATTGSVVNIVTKSGGNNFHGDVLELWRPADTAAALSGFTAANAASGNQIDQRYARPIGGVLSGGRYRSKTHFFVAGRIQPRGSGLADHLAGRARESSSATIADGWPSCAWIIRSTIETISSSASNVDGFHDTNPNGAVGGNSLPTVDRVFRRRTYSEELGETAVLSPRCLNNVRLQFQLASPITEFDPGDLRHAVPGADLRRAARLPPARRNRRC